MGLSVSVIETASLIGTACSCVVPGVWNNGYKRGLEAHTSNGNCTVCHLTKTDTLSLEGESKHQGYLTCMCLTEGSEGRGWLIHMLFISIFFAVQSSPHSCKTDIRAFIYKMEITQAPERLNNLLKPPSI